MRVMLGSLLIALASSTAHAAAIPDPPLLSVVPITLTTITRGGATTVEEVPRPSKTGDAITTSTKLPDGRGTSNSDPKANPVVTVTVTRTTTAARFSLDSSINDNDAPSRTGTVPTSSSQSEPDSPTSTRRAGNNPATKDLSSTRESESTVQGSSATISSTSQNLSATSTKQNGGKKTLPTQVTDTKPKGVKEKPTPNEGELKQSPNEGETKPAPEEEKPKPTPEEERPKPDPQEEKPDPKPKEEEKPKPSPEEEKEPENYCPYPGQDCGKPSRTVDFSPKPTEDRSKCAYPGQIC